MMKSRKLIIFAILTFFLIPFRADAVSMNISINCSQVTVGQTVTCKISGTSDGEVAGIEGNFSISGGASIVAAAKDSTWGNGDFNTSGFSLYTDSNKSNTFSIGTVTIKGDSVGSATFKITGVKAVGSDFNEYSCNSQSKTIYVIAKSTTTTTTKQTTKTTTATSGSNKVTKTTTLTPSGISTTKTTTRTNTTRGTNTTTAQNNPNVPGQTTNISGEYPYGTSTTTAIQIDPETGQPIVITHPLVRLTSVTVDDFEVKYENGKYYVTVNYDTESVTVSATAEEGVTIIGTGLRTLAYGKNIVELVLRNQINQTSTAQVIITRPEDTNEYDVTLSSLKVVGYDLDFKKGQTEYTITIPTSVDELYVMAGSDNQDVIINGTGLQTLKSGNNDIYIKVSYGDLASRQYIIHVKRSKQSLFMWIAIFILGISLIGLSVYYYLDKRKNKENANAAKNKVLAEANRAAVAGQTSVSINGQSVLGIGKTTVVPTKVVDIKQPSNPVAVATSQPKEVKTVQMSSSSPQPQVKVIKRTVIPQPIQNNQPSRNYNKDDNIVTNLK